MDYFVYIYTVVGNDSTARSNQNKLIMKKKAIAKSIILQKELSAGRVNPTSAEVNEYHHLVIDGGQYYFYDNAEDAAHDLEIVTSLI